MEVEFNEINLQYLKLKDEIDNGCTFIPFSLDSVMLSSFRPLIN